MNTSNTHEEVEEVLSSLTDDQVKQLNEVIEDNIPEDVKNLRKIQDGEIPEKIKDEVSSIKATINPETGSFVMSQSSETDDVEAKWEQMIAEVSDVEAIEFTKDNMEQGLKSIGYTDPDDELSISEFEAINAMVKKREAGEKISYNDLPPRFQSKVMNTIAELGNETNAPYLSNKELKNQMTQMFIDSMANEIVNNELQSTMLNLGTTINDIVKKELGNIVNTDRTQQHKIMLEQLPDIASRIKNEKPERAEFLLKVSDAYKESFTLEKMFNSYAKGKPKIKKIDIEKVNRLCKEFNSKYSNSKWVIQDVAAMITSLNRNLKDSIDINTIKAFVALFIKYTMNMSPNNLWEHTFMYYTIYNISSLDLYKPEAGTQSDSEFYENLLNNIYRITDLIQERIS